MSLCSRPLRRHNSKRFIVYHRILNVGHIEAANHTMVLHSFPKGEAIQFAGCWLEDIQPSIQNHLPSGISGDVTGVQRSASIKGPGEFNARARASVRDPVETFPLLLNVYIFCCGDEMD